MILTNFTGPFYTSESGIVADDLSVNLYPELVESGTGKNPYALYGTPGLQVFAQAPGLPIRALAYSEQGIGLTQFLYCISGNNLYKFAIDGTRTLLGTVGSGGTGAAQIIVISYTQLFVVADGIAYIVNPVTPSVTVQSTPAAFVASAAYLDTYIIINDLNTRLFYISGVGDPTSWSALDVGTKESHPDFIQCVYGAFEQLWLFGDTTTEVWFNSGAPNFPFQRIPNGGVIETGVSSRSSIAQFETSLMWVTNTDRGHAMVVEAQGLLPVRVSNHAVEDAIRQYGGDLTDCVGFPYQENGHNFYVLSFPFYHATAPTWVYDLTTKMWHQRAYWDGNTYSSHKGRFCTFAFPVDANIAFIDKVGKHYVAGGDPTDPNIYRQSLDYYDDGGSVIRRQRRFPHITDEAKKTRFSELIIDMLKGAGSVSGNLRYSDDGGITFGNTHTRVSQSGQARMVWRQLGAGRDRVFDYFSTSSVKHAYASAYLRVSKGR